MVEKGRSEPNLGTEEILDVNFSGIYGRFFLASQHPTELGVIAEILDPKEKFNVKNSEEDISIARDYNPITKKLSTDERTQAWQGMGFEEAIGKWKTQFVGSVNSATEEKQIDAIHVVTGVTADAFKDEDAQGMYDKFCKGKSDTTGFVSSIREKLKKDDGKIDTVRLKDLMPHLERLSAQLFGKESAKAIAKMIELEAELNNKQNEAVAELFSDRERINNLLPPEVDMLKLLHDGLSERSPAQSNFVTPQTEAARSEPTTSTPDLSQESTDPNPQDRTEEAQSVNTEGEGIIFPSPIQENADDLSSDVNQSDSTLPETNGNSDKEQNETIERLVREEDKYTWLIREELKQEQGTKAALTVPFETIRNDLFTLIGNVKSDGTTEYIITDNIIIIRELNLIYEDQIDTAAKLTFDVKFDTILSNSKNNGIKTEMKGFKGKRLAKGVVGEKVVSLGSDFRKLLNAGISQSNPGWKATRLLIEGENIRISFSKSQSSS